jgi:secreted trypsin-like serine protease
VSIRSSNKHLCGGAIIATQWIITACHCTILSSANELTVRFGSKYREKGGELIRVKSIFNHPNYDPGSFNFDVALLELVKPMKLVPGTKEIIQLPKQNDSAAVGALTLVSEVDGCSGEI